MIKENLCVKNFFSLKDIDIEISKYNLFIGEQASGKSILMKLVYFFRYLINAPITSSILLENIPDSSLDDYLFRVHELVFNSFSELFKVDVTSLSNDFKLRYTRDEFTITITLKNNQFVIEYSDSLLGVYKTSINFMASLLKSFNQSSQIPQVKNSVMQSHALDLIKKYSLVSSNSTFFPAGRTFLVSLHRNLFKTFSNVALDSKFNTFDSLLLLFGDRYQQSLDLFAQTTSESLSSTKKLNVINYFDDKFSKIIKGQYRFDQAGGFITQKNTEVRPWHSSSGQQESLPIYLVLRDLLVRGQTDCLYVEEPEAHLYPTGQKDMLESLVYVTNMLHSDGLFITTHSPYIVTVLDNLITANEVKDKQNIISKDLLVSFDTVRAYYINDGRAISLMNEEYRLIDAEYLDQVSEEISAEYSKMVHLNE